MKTKKSFRVFKMKTKKSFAKHTGLWYDSVKENQMTELSIIFTCLIVVLIGIIMWIQSGIISLLKELVTILAERCGEMADSLEQDSSKSNIKNVIQILRHSSTVRVTKI